MSDTLLLTRCQEGKPYPIGWAHRDIYGEICLKDILATNMTVNMSVGLSAYQNFFVFALTFCYRCCRWIYPNTPLVWKSLFLRCCWPAWLRWPVVPYTQNWSDLLPGSVRCGFSIHSDTNYIKWYNPKWYLVLGKCIHTASRVDVV